MDETGNHPEVDPSADKTAQTPAAEAKIPEPPKAEVKAPDPPKEEGSGRKRDWTQVALIVLSVAVVLLLASTITLAVTGDFGHGARGDRWSRGRGGPGMHDFRRWPPGNEGELPRWRQQRQELNDRNDKEGSGNQDGGEQAPQSQQTAPGQQQAPQQQVQ